MTPTFFLFAEDDPVCNVKCVPYEEFIDTNDSVILGTVKAGGHMGFLQGPKMTQWFTEPMYEFLNAVREGAHLKNVDI